MARTITHTHANCIDYYPDAFLAPKHQVLLKTRMKTFSLRLVD